MSKQKTIWTCGECGHTQHKWSGSCNSCQNWNTFSEEVAYSEKSARYIFKRERGTKPVLIQDVDQSECKRVLTSYRDLDRTLGGGIVEGSLLLLGGEPGIGKSTLLLQISHRLAEQGLTVLYICGEESTQQTSLRARRLGIKSNSLYLLSETAFSAIKREIDELRPDVLIIDSVQIVYKDDIPSAPGSVTQVREVALECMHLAKGSGIIIFLIGHVTKTGDLAGPRVLEHLVDAVLEFEGDRQHGYRLLRCVKNRFGPTDDVALFEMGELGLKEVFDPSHRFLEERMKDSSGSVIIPTIEGTRAILVEVQALVAFTSYATPSRRTTGLDPKRLTLLLAVIEKRVGIKLHSHDVFVSIVGGLKIVEPAIDLGVVLAIVSSISGNPLPPDTLVMGEVGLGGEVRSVPRVENRIKEAIRMGFAHCILSKKNIRGINDKLKQKINLIGVDKVEQAIGGVWKSK